MDTGKPRTRRGFVLLICMSVLALLALLASTFTMLARMERSVSRNYVDKARAKLLAQAGMEVAITNLKKSACSQNWDDLTPSVAPDLTGTYWSTWAYGDGPGIPIEFCQRCSYQAFQSPLSSSPTPLTIAGNVPQNFSTIPNTNAISGALAATYSQGWDAYVLKILDTSSQIDLNMTNNDFPTILTNLSAAIPPFLVNIGYTAKTGRNYPNPILSPADVNNIVNLRASLGGAFRSKNDLLPTITQDQFDALKDFVCVTCYRDTGAILPNAKPAFPSTPYVPTAPSGGWIGRAPMNINTAPWPVLVAWVQGVQGYMLTPPNPGASGYVTTPYPNGKSTSAAINAVQAQNIATAIVNRRINHPFHSQDDVAHFIQNPYAGSAKAIGPPQRDPWAGYDLVHDPTVNLTTDQAAALIANANPSLTTNKCFGTIATWNSVDKCDMLHLTWEACFSSMGYFEIESMGRVLPPNPNWPNTTPPTSPATGNPPLILSDEAKVKAVVRIYTVYRQTTQQDFTTAGGPWSGQTFSTTATSVPESGTPSQYEGAITLKDSEASATAGAPPLGSVGRETNYPAWDPPAPANSSQTYINPSFNPPTPPPIVTVANGGDLLPDGELFLANDMKQQTYQIVTNLTGANQGPLLDEGAFEFWIRLITDPTVGSGEPLLYLCTTGSKGGPEYQGATVKVERFGNKLYCSRIIWGWPNPSAPPWYFITSVYQLGDISSWHMGTWHHIAVEWKDYPPPYSNMNITPNDVGTVGVGSINGNDVATWIGTSPEARDLWFWIDGVQQGGFYERWAPSATYNFPGLSAGVTATFQYRMLLTSKDTPPGGNGNGPFPISTFDVGGYKFDSTGASIDYVTQSKTMPNQKGLWLYSDCVFDNLKIYSSGSDPLVTNQWSPTAGNPGWHHNSNLSIPIDRYNATATPPDYTAVLNLTSLRNSGTISSNAYLGTISWQTRSAAYGAGASSAQPEINLWPTANSGSADQAAYPHCDSWIMGAYNQGLNGGFANQNTYGAIGTPALSAYCSSAGGYPLNYIAINKPVGVAPTLTYTIRLFPPMSPSPNVYAQNVPFTAAPVVEDILITIVDTPKFVSWEVY